MGKKTAIVILAPGFEPSEAVISVDLLRRADIEVTVAGVGEAPDIQGMYHVSVVCDAKLSDCVWEKYDVTVLPGGMPGATNLAKDDDVKKLLDAAKASGSLIAAICASPGAVLLPLGILDGCKEATAYPGFDKGPAFPKCKDDKKTVCYSGNILTSKGPGTAVDFALKIIEVLKGKEASEKIKSQIVYKL